MKHLCLQRQIECLKRGSLAAAFPIIVTDYCNFPLTMKTEGDRIFIFSVILFLDDIRSLEAYFIVMLLLCESNRKVVPLSETFYHKLTKF